MGLFSGRFVVIVGYCIMLCVGFGGIIVVFVFMVVNVEISFCFVLLLLLIVVGIIYVGIGNIMFNGLGVVFLLKECFGFLFGFNIGVINFGVGFSFVLIYVV